MARIKVHGSVRADFQTVTGTKYRLMSDGYVLMNYGTGWKLWKRAKDSTRGVDLPLFRQQELLGTVERMVQAINRAKSVGTLIHSN